jgi:hypothetical protein
MCFFSDVPWFIFCGYLNSQNPGTGFQKITKTSQKQANSFVGYLEVYIVPICGICLVPEG